MIYTATELHIYALHLIFYADFNSKYSEEVGHAHVHVAFFLNISCEPIGYTIQKSALARLNGAEWIYR